MGAAPGAGRFLGFDDMAGAEKRLARHRVVGVKQSKLKRPRIVAVGSSDGSSAIGSGFSRAIREVRQRAGGMVRVFRINVRGWQYLPKCRLKRDLLWYW